MSHRESMSSIDTAWLRMDRPVNRMTIVTVLACEQALSHDRFKRVIAERFLRHQRFRERVVAEGNSAYWERDPHFDLDFHVKRTALPSPGGKHALHDLVGDLVSTPFDPGRPLWQFHLVDDYQGGSAIISRIHHCYADGIALMQVLLSMTDESSTASEPAEIAADDADEGGGDVMPDWLAPVTNTVNEAVKLGGGLLSAYFDLILHPTHAIDYARQGVDLTAEAARLALMPTDSPTRFKGTPTGIKRAAWTDRLSLHEIKAVAHATGCSVNDVLLSCAAGALRAYLAEKGDPVDGVEVRALVPVNMRPPSEAQALGNRFGLVAVLLPVGIENPLERLYQVKNRMHDLKSSSQALVTLSLLATLGMGPKALQEQILDLLANRASAVMTNVPGPQKPLYLGGSRLKEIVFWVPQSAAIGMGISMLSYDDGVQFGVITDKNMVSDPERIAAQFPKEFERLLLAALMSSAGSSS